MKTLCGIRPTGRLHIGHYFSVIKPGIDGADVLIADYHGNPELGDDMEKRLFGYGVRTIRQKERFSPALYFRLVEASRIGELERMTQYKSAKIKTPQLLMYPALMAHDIVGYDRVIVGEDQRQHLEYAKVLLTRIGLKCPIGVFDGGKIMSLTDPTKKMSKSEPEGCLFLDEDPTKKIMGAVTTPEGIKNLKEIARRLGVEYNESKNEASKRLLVQALSNLLPSTQSQLSGSGEKK